MAVQHKNGKDGKRRGNHTGTLIKRGKTYLAQWSVRGPDGKRKRISKSTHCKNIEDDVVKIWRVLDNRRDPEWIERQLVP